MERPTHAGLRHLALTVRDLAAMKRFYVDLLGFAVEWEPDAENVYLSSGIDNLALHAGEPTAAGAHSTSSGQAHSTSSGQAHSTSTGQAHSTSTGQAHSTSTGQALDHLGLIVRAADDVDRWAAFLESRGVTLKAKPKTHRDGARSLYLQDPDGNSVQIIHHPPISQKT